MDSLWYACSEPERPTDPFVQWHYDGCNACWLKVQVVEFAYPHDEHVTALVRRMATNREAA